MLTFKIERIIKNIDKTTRKYIMHNFFEIDDSLPYYLESSLGLLYDNKQLVSAVIFDFDNTTLDIHYIETDEKQRGFGYGTILIKDLVRMLKVNNIEGFIKNSFEAFSFWNTIANVFHYKMNIEEEDKPYLNEEDYDFEYDLHIKVNE